MGNQSNKHSGDGGLGGILKGVTELVTKLGELAETREEVSRSGSVQGGDPEKGVRGEYSFSLRVGGLGGETVTRRAGPRRAQGVREPAVDLLEEDYGTLVVAEMPGIVLEDLKLDLTDDILTLEAERGEKKYRTEVLLPERYERKHLHVSYNNGIVEIKCMKPSP